MRARSVSILLILSLPVLTVTSCVGTGDDNTQVRATANALPQAAATVVELGVGWFSAHEYAEGVWHDRSRVSLSQPDDPAPAEGHTGGGGDGPNECLIAAGREG